MKLIRRLYSRKRKKLLLALALSVPVVFLVLLLVSLITNRINTFNDPGTGIIVIDPGHGGIDGGTSHEGLLEKEINLSIARRVQRLLVERGFHVVMTREEDVSLEGLVDSGGSRHLRDLQARTGIINGSQAQLFLSIHVNSNVNNRNASGAVVYYSDRYEQNKVLAYCIQRALNGFIYQGSKRIVHDPRTANYYILDNARLPGVIAEVAFISNKQDWEALATDEFRDKIAESLVNGTENYYREMGINRTRIATPGHAGR